MPKYTLKGTYTPHKFMQGTSKLDINLFSLCAHFLMLALLFVNKT